MIKSDIVGGIAVLTLTHGKANALDIELCDALAARFKELRKSGEKAVVVTGQGKIFSAGVDLKCLSSGGADYIRQFLPACIVSMKRYFFIRSRWSPPLTVTPSRAAVCSHVAPIAGSWGARQAASV